MQLPVSFSLLLAQASQTAVATAWWQEPWASWVILAACVVVSSLAAWVIARGLGASDVWPRLATVLVSLAVGLVVMTLGWPPRLGIDLKGGVILVYEIDNSKRSTAAIESVAAGFEQLLERQGAKATVSWGGDGRISVTFASEDAAAEDAFVKGVEAGAFGSATVKRITRDREPGTIAFAISGRTDPVDMDKLVAAVSRRVNPGGQKEVTVRRYGLDQIEVIVPAVDRAEIVLIKRIVSSAGVLEFRILANPDDPRHRQVIEIGTRVPGSTVSEAGRRIGRWVRLDTTKMDPSRDRGLVTRAAPDGAAEVLVVLDRFDVTGGYLTRAMASFDNLEPCVNFGFSSAGAARFGALTAANLPDPANRLESRLGILLDDVLLSAPTIRSTITSSGQITGSFKQSDVDFLVGVLNAGSLPAALGSEPVSEQAISPQLGADTIRSGARAMVLSLVAVLAFMLLYYRFAGLVADLAVALNLILVVAILISLKAALTLAGLAGLVLSVGMAVDANVLIYERIREEVGRGASLRMAIRNGFQRAFATIVDSNLTTLITGVVLYAIGTDQLKGFAIALILGLTLNLFTAVFCARVVFDLAERSGAVKRLSMMRLLASPSYEFVRWTPVALAISGFLVAAGLVAAVARGQGLFDIDFTGGTSVQIEFQGEKALGVADVRSAVSALPDVAVSSISSADVPPGLRYKIDTSEKEAEVVETRLREAFKGRLRTYSVMVGEVTQSASDAAVAPGEPVPAEATGEMVSMVPLEFPERITGPLLEEAISRAMIAAGHEGQVFELETSEPGGESRPCRTWGLSTPLAPDLLQQVLGSMKERLEQTPVYLSANTIGGKVAGNTQVTAFYALVASMVMIVLSVWLRFHHVGFGLAAVVALIHDVLVTVACIAMSSFLSPGLGWALVDDFKISLDVVAALLTIVGFSINDTIVIFDRLREIRGKSPVVTTAMVDRAVNETLSRTILTSGTAFIATLVLYLAGGQGIHAFAFTMLVGIISGTFSTIFIASPLALRLQGGREAAGRARLERSGAGVAAPA
ncbi:MAG: protein translocase subunit SecD [Planctomycetaceae bacterium]